MQKIKKFDLAVSIGNKNFLEEKGFSDMQKSGIKGIELSFNDYSNMDFDKIRRTADNFGVDIWSLHLPFMPFEEIDISSIDNKVRANSVDLLKELISQSADIGIKRFVVHASGEPVLPPVRSERMKCSKDSLFSLSEFAKKYDSVIAVENLPRTCLGKNADEINELVSANDNLNVCFDTNHLLGETAKAFFDKINKKIETIHVSDYDFVDEKHWLPLCGKVDWQEIIGLLNQKNYVGPFLYEISFRYGNYPTGKEVTFEDIYNNYSKFFDRRADKK